MPNHFRHGMILGKFLPPHKGHCLLADFAGNFVEELTIVVGTLPSEPIPGELRYRWMKEMFPQAHVIHLDKIMPQDPSEHPDFWDIWERELKAILPQTPDILFASESYGHKLAEVLGARFIPLDPQRNSIPTSGTAIRENPFDNWQYIPALVRPYFLKRICLFGPESTGKSTMAEKLANHFETTFVPEYARTYLEEFGEQITPESLLDIAHGQTASEDSLCAQSNRLLFCDTDPLLTTIWSHFLLGKCEEPLQEFAQGRNMDLYLLTEPDVPWVADPVRYLPDDRKNFFENCKQTLKEANRDYLVLSGSWEDRFETAKKAIQERFLENRPCSLS